MMSRAIADQWYSLGDPHECERLIREWFDVPASFRRWQVTSHGKRAPVFTDGRSELEWVLVPAGSFEFGLSNRETEQALKLSKEPFLSFEEMKPTSRVLMKAFLVSMAPVSQQLFDVEGMESIGPRDTGLCSSGTAAKFAETMGSFLPTELEWEYACRGGSQSLFWFGETVPKKTTMEQILGLREPELPNGFGLVSLFFGEWCSDIWKKDLAPQTPPSPDAGPVIRGGGARFWPWQDSREWSGCVSSYRMSEQEAGGEGAAVRLVKRMKDKA